MGGQQTEYKFFFDTKTSVFVCKDGYKPIVRKVGDTTLTDFKEEQIRMKDSLGSETKYYSDQVYDEGNVIYKNLRDSTLIFREKFEKSAMLVTEPKLPIIQWKILDEKKMIDVYECQKATTTFRGRNYEAWYALKIPISNGPWKLHGLPGLILEFKTDDNKYAMKFVRIVIPIEDASLLKKPTSGDRIEFSNYSAERIKYGKQSWKDMMDNMRKLHTEVRFEGNLEDFLDKPVLQELDFND